jgi:hypothetical protein
LTKKAPYKGLGADSEEKHEPVSDIDTIVVDGLKALDPEWPIREATLLFGADEVTLRAMNGLMRCNKFGAGFEFCVRR